MRNFKSWEKSERGQAKKGACLPPITMDGRRESGHDVVRKARALESNRRREKGKGGHNPLQGKGGGKGTASIFKRGEEKGRWGKKAESVNRAKKKKGERGRTTAWSREAQGGRKPV